MSGPIGAAALIGIGYLIGAIPFGILAGRLAGGIDLRQHGSRRTGATNTLRTLGLRWAAVVLALDLAKGVAAVLLAWAAYLAGPPGSPEWVAAAAGVAAVIGHNWSAFIGFSGGRGVATSAGGLLVISPLTLVILVPLVVAVVWWTRYVSVGSLVAAVAAPILTAVLSAAGIVGWAATGFAVASGVLIIASHADNLSRLRSGTERRIGEGAPMENDGRS